MATTRTNSRNHRKRLPRDGRFVKAQIVRAGVGMGELAAEAGMALATLSQHINGRRRVARRQIAIWEAFCRIAKTRGVEAPTLGGFWGKLLNERLAA